MAYWHKRHAELRAQEGIGHVQAENLDAISAALAPLASEHRCDAHTGRGGGMSAAFLVRCENISAFRRAVKAFSTTHADMALFCTGPWPPFSFVTQSISDRMST
jgi:hypothetical protein